MFSDVPDGTDSPAEQPSPGYRDQARQDFGNTGPACATRDEAALQLGWAVELLGLAKQQVDGDRSSLCLDAELADGSVLAGRYQFVRRLGEGGCGIVVLAHDRHLDRAVAIKVPRADLILSPKAIEWFIREAQNVAKLNHPNIVRALDIADATRSPAIVYEYCAGPTLADWIEQLPGPLDESTVASIGVLLAEAVAHAHSRSILHLDLKPGNILLEPSSEGEQLNSFCAMDQYWTPRIIDFGVSKVILTTLDSTITQSRAGTPAYMAPEQLQGGPVGTYSDVYALGMILFELLTGTHPRASSGDCAAEHPSSIALGLRSRRPEVSSEMESIVAHCTHVDCTGRYRAAAHLADDLRKFLANKPISVRPASRMQAMVNVAKREPLLTGFAMACLALVGFLACGVIMLSTRRQVGSDGSGNSHGAMETVSAIDSQTETSKPALTMAGSSQPESSQSGSSQLGTSPADRSLQPDFRVVRQEKRFDFSLRDAVAASQEPVEVALGSTGAWLTYYGVCFDKGPDRDVAFDWSKNTARLNGLAPIRERGAFEGMMIANIIAPQRRLLPNELEAISEFSERSHTSSTHVFPDRQSAMNGSASNLIALDNLLQGKLAVANVLVDSSQQKWHTSLSLSPGKYLVVPDPQSHWSIGDSAPGRSDIEYHGIGNFDGKAELGAANPMRLGGLAGCLEPLDPKFLLSGFQFNPGTYEFLAVVPDGGAILSFLIADKNGAYVDNRGSCRVLIFATE